MSTITTTSSRIILFIYTHFYIAQILSEKVTLEKSEKRIQVENGVKHLFSALVYYLSTYLRRNEIEQSTWRTYVTTRQYYTFSMIPCSWRTNGLNKTLFIYGNVLPLYQLMIYSSTIN